MSRNRNETKESVLCPYIGTMYTHFPEKRGTPRQPGICSNLVAKLVLNSNIFTNPEHALDGLQEYSHMWILFHFHKNDSTHTRAKVTPPRLNGHRLGVFATRSPNRPSPIGLSLVKIDRIMENVIYFSGVDMIDQTPVIDIKPYIPQYDSPNVNMPLPYCDENLVEENSNSPAPDTYSLFNISAVNDSQPDENGISQVTEALDNLNVRDMDGEEDEERNNDMGGPTLNIRQSFPDSRSLIRMGEREAPDGEEEESERQASGVSITFGTSPSSRDIRTPAWINNPPVPILTVYFRERALSQLQQMGVKGEQKKAVIENILKEDPRSVYLRERIENSNYVFRIAELYVSCRFDDRSHTVTVFQVFQENVVQNEQ
ncbi:tRNA (adenine(37)-N6)-methyltransferase isoform X2 [Agrilus planipennis]|nr:tRNA (adenine(37)-N6)-methyltransferase isoform X2 [Agrilus planipennis]